MRAGEGDLRRTWDALLLVGRLGYCAVVLVWEFYFVIWRVPYEAFGSP